MKIEFNPNDLLPIIQQTIAQTIEAMQESQAKVPDGRIAYTEVEAATLIGVAKHSLRDARLRGELNASRCGKRVVYQRSELLKYLTDRKINP